ncbi:MAG: DNA alkylation repair protein [Bacteroidota bacterium]
MTAQEVLKQLAEYGDERTKNTLMNHGAREPFFGVKVADLKKILKQTKKNHELSLALYDTGNSDAMYLAGLMADEKQITKEQLQHWVDKAYWYFLSEYTVAWVASETEFGFELGLEWIDSEKEGTAAAGWSTLASYASVHEDNDLDVEKYKALLDRVATDIHSAKNRVKYTMNNFVIAAGSFVKALNQKAIEVAKGIGPVAIDMNGTACKVPLAKDYLQKVVDKGRIGKKKKTARC